MQRPAKNIERKMMAEAVGRLHRVRALDDFQYVGFGSIYFADFALFHRLLGLKKMISIENSAADAAARDRFELNKPYAAVELLWGEAENVLRRIPWTDPSFVWLDFDGTLDGRKIEALTEVFSKASSPSVVALSLQVNPEEPPENRLQMLQDSAPGEHLPPWVTVPKDLAKWGTADAVHDILTGVVARIAKERNGRFADDDERLVARQVFHFHYADDAQMLTVGWLLYQQGIAAGIDECRIYELPFVVDDGADACHIDVPNLTHRERAMLDRLLPDEPLDSVPIPDSEREQYKRLYRHFPGYVDAVP